MNSFCAAGLQWLDISSPLKSVQWFIDPKRHLHTCAQVCYHRWHAWSSARSCAFFCQAVLSIVNIPEGKSKKLVESGGYW